MAGKVWGIFTTNLVLQEQKDFKVDYPAFSSMLFKLMSDYAMTDIERKQVANRIISEIDITGRNFVSIFDFSNQTEDSIEERFQRIFRTLFGKQVIFAFSH